MSFSPDNFARQQAYTFADLLDLVRFLRSPQGCAWDRAQTHVSVRRNLLEEAYEVVEGIDRDDPKILREELGDFLFQAAFHIVMEEERAHFTPADVLQDICRKMVTRHPHLFAREEHLATEEVPARWEELKKKEKGQISTADTLASLPKTLPALMYAQKMSEKVARVGFTYETAEAAGDKVMEEWAELQAAKDPAAMREEYGDLLFALVNYGRLLGLEAEEALSAAASKFAARFAGCERILEEDGRKMAECTKNEILAAWNEQKNTEKVGKTAKK